MRKIILLSLTLLPLLSLPAFSAKEDSTNLAEAMEASNTPNEKTVPEEKKTSIPTEENNELVQKIQLEDLTSNDIERGFKEGVLWQNISSVTLPNGHKGYQGFILIDPERPTWKEMGEIIEKSEGKPVDLGSFCNPGHNFLADMARNTSLDSKVVSYVTSANKIKRIDQATCEMLGIDANMKALTKAYFITLIIDAETGSIDLKVPTSEVSLANFAMGVSSALSSTQREIDKLNHKIQKEKERASTQFKELDNLKEQMPKLENAVEEALKAYENNSAVAQLKELEADLANNSSLEANDQYKEQKTAVEKAQQDFDVAKQKYDTDKQAADSASTRRARNAAQSQVNASKAEMDNKDKALKTAQEALAKIESDFKAGLKNQQDAIEKLKPAAETVQKQLDEAKQNLAETESKINALNTDQAVIAATFNISNHEANKNNAITKFKEKFNALTETLEQENQQIAQGAQER